MRTPALRSHGDVRHGALDLLVALDLASGHQLTKRHGAIELKTFLELNHLVVTTAVRVGPRAPSHVSAGPSSAPPGVWGCGYPGRCTGCRR